MREYALNHFDVIVENFKELYEEDFKSKLYAFKNSNILKFRNHLRALKGQDPIPLKSHHKE